MLSIGTKVYDLGRPLTAICSNFLGISRDFADIWDSTTAKRIKKDPYCQRRNLAH